MAGEWEETTVGELVKRGVLERPLDGNHGSIHPKGDDFVATGVPFIMASDLVGGGIDTVNCSFISIEQAKSLRKGFAKRGDVLISHKATLGRTALVGEIPGDFVMLTPQVTYYRPKDATRLHNRYLKYYFDSEQFQQVLQSWAGAGSTRAYIGITDQLRLPVLLPPLAEQKAIAAVLGALDDKIELNRRMNATLEAMARALFQSWFVDFDSVRAKLDGRPPAALDPATAALFPEHLEDSPLGHIPKGWEVGRLDDVLTLQRGFDLPTPDRTHGKYPVMAASGPNGCHDKFMVRGPGVTTGRSGVLGRVFFIHGDFWPLNTSLWVKEFKRVSPAYAFHLLRGLDFEMFNAGSAVPTLNRNHVHNLPVVMPPKNIVEAFNAQVMPLMKRQKANEDQSRALATLRDTLLPKLLSGELSVAEATVNRDFQVQPGMPKP